MPVPPKYQIEVNGQKAVIRKGKVQTESEVNVEEGDTKFDATVVRYAFPSLFVAPSAAPSNGRQKAE